MTLGWEGAVVTLNPACSSGPWGWSGFKGWEASKVGHWSPLWACEEPKILLAPLGPPLPELLCAWGQLTTLSTG